MGRKVDGYIAVSPQGSVSEVALSRLNIEYRMTGIQADSFKKYEEMVVALESERNEMLKEGWQIKPVYIVDASPDAKEVVVPRELVDWVAEIRKGLGVETPGLARVWLMNLDLIWPEQEAKDETKT